jgi:hypothetical protein
MYILGTLLFHGLFGDEKGARPYGGYFETLAITYKENISREILNIYLLIQQICDQIGLEMARTRTSNIILIIPELSNIPITLSISEFLQIVYTTLNQHLHQSQFTYLRQSFIELSTVYKIGIKTSSLLENISTEKEKENVYIKNKITCKLLLWPPSFHFHHN